MASVFVSGASGRAVEQDDKGFAQRFQLFHHPLFGGQVVFPGDLADGAIGGDHDADGGVIPDDLAGTGLSGKVKGDLFLEPGAFDHTGLLVFLVAHGSLHHIAHTVDKPDAALPAALQLERHGLFRDELRLRGHDRSPCRRLWQLISGPELCVRRADGRQHQLLHKLLDEGALAGTHRPHHANQDLPAGACPDLPADSASKHSCFSKLLSPLSRPHRAARPHLLRLLLGNSLFGQAAGYERHLAKKRRLTEKSLCATIEKN